jgi:PLP dependent protein
MSEAEMKMDPARAKALASQLNGVSERLATVAKGKQVSNLVSHSHHQCITTNHPSQVRLVAVSKLKPANDILALHQGPSHHSHFGENYAQELQQKAALLPPTIRWHFIGGLQSGHCKAIARVPNVWCVSSVDTLKKARLLDKARGDIIASATAEPAEEGGESDGAVVPERLNVHVQVNTSGEDSKSGVAPGEATTELCRAIVRDCPSLRLLGLMTIGAIARSRAATSAEEENEDFVVLKGERDRLAGELELTGHGSEEGGTLELSMGMSDDFESAVALGSDEVRIGSTIFGERPAKADAKITA